MAVPPPPTTAGRRRPSSLDPADAEHGKDDGIERDRDPASSSPTDPTADPGLTADQQPAGTAPTFHVLLVEDEPALQTLFVRVLTRGGFTVTAFGDGSDALRSVLERPDLLLTDLTVPGRTGTELAAAVTVLYPGTPVLFMSGYGPGTSPPGQLLPPGADLITKPFTGGELLARARAAVAGTSAASDGSRSRSGRRARTVTPNLP